ncbi:unnamed protein product [Calypogeia fissa]
MKRASMPHNNKTGAAAAAALESALVSPPQLMDNPLYEVYSEDDASTVTGQRNNNGGAVVEKSRLSDQLLKQQEAKQQQQPWRSSLSSLSLDEATTTGVSTTKPTRRIQSWSLSSRDYEGMWRTVQENVFKSRRESMSALEDFKQFRQKLADLKQVKEDVSAPPPTPKVLTPSGSIRSSNLGSVSTRSWNLSPSRPTSPLQRLSVINLRKGVSGLNPQRESGPHRGGAGGQQLPPSVHRFALSMRAEGLFKLPNPASISPLLTDQSSSPPPPEVIDKKNLMKSTVTASKRRFLKGGRAAAAEEQKRPVIKASDAAHKDGGGPMMGGACSPRTASKSLRSCSGRGQTRSSIAAALTNEVESFMYSCSPRSLANSVNTVAPRTPRNSITQQQTSKKKSETISVASFCSPRAKDMKARCISIPRPMCYSSHILE